MCLAVPGKILSIENDMAEIDLAGTIRKCSLQFIPEAEVGQYILLHAGFAIQLMDEDEARETLKLLEEMNEVSG